jgi:hypothetical protein
MGLLMKMTKYSVKMGLGYFAVDTKEVILIYDEVKPL